MRMLAEIAKIAFWRKQTVTSVSSGLHMPQRKIFDNDVDYMQ